jgi:hypothetical protein
MNIFTRSFIAVLVCVMQITTPAYAEQLFCSTPAETSPFKTVIVYGNGILNTQRDANDSLTVIQRKLRSKLPAEKFATLDFKLAYNQSVGIFTDMRETWRQKTESDNFDSLFWRMTSGLTTIPVTLQNDYKKRLASLDAWGPLEKFDITIHLNLYRELIRDGKKVVVVAHSQGNLFANKAYDILYSGNDALTTNSFGIVAVATPASFVGGNGFHTTLETDHIIATVKNESSDSDRNLALPLPWNVQNSPTGWDLEGHAFVGEYLLDGSLSESKIIGDILYTNNRLEKYTPSANAITISIISKAMVGMNFSIMGPLNTGVRELTPIGVSAWVELADQTGCKIEIHTVPYSKLTEGFYLVELAYTSWQTSSKVMLEVTAGALTQRYILPTVGLGGVGLYPDSFASAGVEITRDIVTQEYLFRILSPLSAVPPTFRYGAF